MGNPHVLAIPYPAQGHVIPVMEIALRLVKHGIRVTFVNTVFNHERVIKSLSDAEKLPELLNLVSIPDGLEPWEDRNDVGKSIETLIQFVPGKLEALIDDINGGGEDKITCLLADESTGWLLDVAEKMGIRGIAFWPAAAAMFALKVSLQKLIDDGIIDGTGSLLKKNMVQLSPGMPQMEPSQFFWVCIGDVNTQRIVFDAMMETNRTVKKADWVISNSTHVLEKPTFNSFPEVLPIGPLLANNRLGKPIGSFWSEDSNCLTWLDKQPPQSVIYVAFGSFTVFDQTQFQELALGLELTNMPFLWVVRPDSIEETGNAAYPTGFKNRILGRGWLASWVPQQDVLSHPSVACFLSHCGWNSTLEGVSNGIPFLCWPYFADQFVNQRYICDIWKVGLGFNRNKNEIIERGEIKNKVDQLLSDEKFKARALELKAKIMDSVKEDGCSGKNFANLINWIKDLSAN